MILYDIDARNTRGENVSMKQYEGKVLLVVNIATECGFSYQLEGFQSLFTRYQDKGFLVLAFPSNSFKKEPDDNAEIQNKCNTLFKITFPLFEKVSVKGDDIHPLFQWLITQKRGFITKGIKYNYTKFLIDREGHVLKRYAPFTKPETIRADLEALL
ncbi:MAG TPA: glutathione peroxidase [Candidatus Izemoplasmatales bacterium]|nr:glutathione peroxidase [Candidatus Izemoplasmatales bacterium]